MRICHFIASRGLGWGEIYVDLANAQCGENEVILLIPQGALFLERVDQRVRIVEYRSRDRRANPFLLYEIYSLVKEIQPEIVHTHFAKATEIFSLVNRLLKLPWTATKHNPRKGKIFNRIDQVIAVSEEVAKSIQHGRVKVIYNGICPVEMPDAEDITSDMNEKMTILAVGRLEKIKAFDRLIEACAGLDFDFNLLLAGDGPERLSLAALARSSGVADQVSFLGFRRDIPELMKHADVVVVCSHSEGFSLVILEALFYARVLLSRPVGIAVQVLPEEFIINDFDIGSRLIDVYRNYADFSHKFRAVRSSQVGHFHIQRMADTHLDYYRQLTRNQ